jgi:hypothetical protein
MRKRAFVPAAAVALAVSAATFAYAASGDQWLGTGSQATDGSPVYQSPNYNLAEWENRTITVSLRNQRTNDGPLVIEARGVVYGDFQPQDGGLPSAAFGFDGTATLKNGAGKVVCRGDATAGGMPADYYMRVSFGKKCPLPGAQLIEISGITGTANLREER